MSSPAPQTQSASSILLERHYFDQVNDFLPERGGWRNVGDSVIARYPRWFVEYIEGMQANHALLPFYMMMMNVSNTDLPPDPIADHLEAQASALVAEAIKAYYEAAQKLSSDFSGVPGPTSTMEEDILKTQCAKRYYVAWRVCRSNRIVDDDVRAKYPKWFCELLEAFDDWFRQGFRAY